MVGDPHELFTGDAGFSLGFELSLLLCGRTSFVSGHLCFFHLLSLFDSNYTSPVNLVLFMTPCLKDSVMSQELFTVLEKKPSYYAIWLFSPSRGYLTYIL